MDARGALTIGFVGFSSVVLLGVVQIWVLVCTIWKVWDAAKSRFLGDLYKLGG
jgi:hypothetical protein